MKKVIIFLFSFSLLFSACNRNNNNDPEPTLPPSMEDLEISDGFNWKTTKDYEVTITGPVNNIVEIASNDNTTYLKAFIKANKPYTMKLTVPSFEESVRILYMGEDISIELDSDNLSYEFN